MNNKRAHAEKRRSGDYNKVSHDFPELILESPAQLNSNSHCSALPIQKIEFARRRITGHHKRRCFHIRCSHSVSLLND
jgi:hypothetical protein